MNLTRLIYAAPFDPLAQRNLRLLITNRHRRLAPLNVTGFLLVSGSRQIEVLEGNRADLSALLADAYGQDSQAGITLITCVEVRERLFSSWRAVLREAGDPKVAEVALQFLGAADWTDGTICPDRLTDIIHELSLTL